MTGGELQIATLQSTANPIPQFTGTYSLTAGRVTVNGTGSQTIRSAASTPTATYHELNFAGSGVKTLSGDVTVNSRLLLNLPTSTGNYVNAGINILTVNNDAVGAVNRTGGHIVGTLRRAVDNTTFPLTYFYPVGSDNSSTATYYEPLFAVLNSTFPGVNFLQSFFSKATPSSNWSPPLSENGNSYTDIEDEGFWDLTPTTGPSGSVSYGARVIPSSGWAYSGTNLALVKRSPASLDPDNKWNWHSSTRISDFERTDYTTFSEFGIASGSTPLPIETSPLTAWPVHSNPSILLQWQSLMEVNLKQYVLQKSLTLNFEHFEDITTLNAHGNNYIYNYQDFQIIPNQLYYYRFKAVDKDGKTQYSNIATAILNNEQNLSFQVFPNPAKETINFSIFTEDKGNLVIEVFDIAQKRVLHFSKEIPENQVYAHKFDLDGLSSGVYAYRISLNGKIITDKFLITR
ncbi:MAG: T9SS type A sorting domain-containing protein [Bacteroidia bacterium]|nr:T9SS type A sorting domain-containing protein [Bacteroidia bacterium]